MDLGDRPRLGVLLGHFALLDDEREAWRVAHPLPEVLLLLVCGTIGACDGFDEIVEWGEDNLPFLGRFLPYQHGVPGSRWLRILLNRIDPGLFSAMFQSWAASLRPDAPALVAIDGKTRAAATTSAKTAPDPEQDTDPPTWQRSDTSPSTSSGPSPTSEASNSDERKPPEIQPTWPKSSGQSVNPDSGPPAGAEAWLTVPARYPKGAAPLARRRDLRPLHQP